MVRKNVKTAAFTSTVNYLNKRKVQNFFLRLFFVLIPSAAAVGAPSRRLLRPLLVTTSFDPRCGSFSSDGIGSRGLAETHLDRRDAPHCRGLRPLILPPRLPLSNNGNGQEGEDDSLIAPG